MNAAVFAAVAIALGAGHHVGDYWMQTNAQARDKPLPNWRGRCACATHVATYTLTLAACVAVAGWWLALPLRPWWVACGLSVSAVTHYVADRRVPIRRLAAIIPGKLGFLESGNGLASGAAYLDQSWHWFWLFISALVITGGPR